ncbi:MAG: zinc ribbon domain-containing protein [bacterium]
MIEKVYRTGKINDLYYHISDIIKDIDKSKLTKTLKKYERKVYSVSKSKSNPKIAYNKYYFRLYNALNYISDYTNIKYILENPNLATQLMNEYNYNPNPWRSYKEQNELRHHKNLNIEQVYSKDYKCKICKKHTVVTWRKQMAAGDEAETVFHLCSSCGAEWRE